MRRPDWWPSGWSWPGRGGAPRPGRLPERPAARRGEPPGASFLATLLEAFGAERAVLFELDRERGVWRVERAVAGPEAPSREDGELPAAGHPLTWCLREELVVQVPARELSGDRSGDGWALAGPVPGASRVLMLTFHGAPPARARRAMRPALDHLGNLAERSGPGPR